MWGIGISEKVTRLSVVIPVTVGEGGNGALEEVMGGVPRYFKALEVMGLRFMSDAVDEVPLSPCLLQLN